MPEHELNDILVHDLNVRSSSRLGRPFVHGMYPWEQGTCWHWDWAEGHRGPIPRYWKYTQAGSCHWLVNFNLKLATMAESKRPWRIVTSEKHSTVWDGSQMLFEFNFLAFGVPPRECFDLAFEDGEVMEPGEFVPVHPLPHYTTELPNH
jgi:hypothetical protein